MTRHAGVEMTWLNGKREKRFVERHKKDRDETYIQTHLELQIPFFKTSVNK